jgi:sister-chromatid-cohesion protein PDS5
MKYACSFLFDITGSNVLESEEDKHNLADIIQHSYQTKVRKISAQTDANSVTLYPHHILPYLVHALAHHSCPDVEKCKDVKEYEMIYRQLYLIISMLLHKEEDGKTEDIDKEREYVPTIILIFHSIKQSEDVTDATKSKNSHAICELGLSIINHLTQKEPDLQGEITPVSLPPTLYKPSEKVEGDKSQVGEEKLWLADETVLLHFRALKLESHADASVIPQTSENEVMIDGESDGNEIPLGKIVERLRAQGTKTRKGKKNKSVPAEDENGKNDVDVLKMVREINLDHLQMLDKFESSNGHKHSPSERAEICQRDQKGNKRNVGDATSVVSVPKRRRSSSGHSPYKFSNSGPKVQLKASEDELHLESDMDKNVSLDSHDENSDQEKMLESISPRKRKKSLSSKLKITESDWALTDVERQSRSAGGGDSKLKSASGSMKKRKNVSGLAKCSTKENKLVNDELIGCRIEVWWPMDKRFYEGTVKSYDSTKQRHVILYEDGDVEVLNLKKEQWELIDTGGKTAKKSRTSKGNSKKKRSSGSKPKNPDGVQRDEDPVTTTPKGKRTPKKNLKQLHPKDTPKSLSLEHEKVESRNKKRRSSALPIETEYSGEAGEEKSESEGKSLKEGEDDEEVVNKEEDLQEAKTESSGDAEGKEAEHDDSDTEGKQENNEMEREAEENAETSDNETLGAWKSKVGKSISRTAI